MPTHAEKRIVPYTPDEMYALIADVGRYPEFLPWCSAARVRGTRPLPDGTGEVMDADLIVSFKVYRERFGSRVTLQPAARTIDVEYLDGPFRYLKNHWRFLDLAPRRLVEERADLEPLRLAGAEDREHVPERAAGVDDVLDEEHVAALDAGAQILQDPHLAARHHGVAVGGGLEEVDLDRQVELAHQVGDEHERAAEQALSLIHI